MYEEGPYEFYLRAKDNFTKSGDIEDAAEVYLSLLNLENHGFTLPENAAVVKAVTLLKDAGVSGSRKSHSITQRRMSRDRERESKQRARPTSKKESKSFRRQMTVGKTWRPIRPFYASSTLMSEIPDWMLGWRSEAAKRDWEAQTRGQDTAYGLARGPMTLRDLLEQHLRENAGEDGIASADARDDIPDFLIDTLYSARPEPSRSPSFVQGRAKEEKDSAHDETVRDHPINRIPLEKRNSFRAIMRDLYREGGEARDIDDAMKDWERKHRKHPHSEKYGHYGDNGVGLEDLFLHGFGLWNEECKKRWGKEGSRNDFVEHLILRNEGIPEERIFDEAYDGNGAFDEDKGESLLGLNWDGRTPRLGLVPQLLGLEALPPEDAKQVLRWWVSGDYREIPGVNPKDPEKNSMLAGAENARGLLQRVWEQRMQALITGPMTRHPLQGSQQFPFDYYGDMEEPDIDVRNWMTALSYARPSQSYTEKKGGKGPRFDKDRTTGLTLFQVMADDRGHLPDQYGRYHDAAEDQPVLNRALVNAWAKNGVNGFDDKMKETLVKAFERVGKYARNDLRTSDGMHAHRSAIMPDGSPSFTDVYHRHNKGGGLNLQPVDVMMFWHDWLDGLMTQMAELPEIEDTWESSESGTKSRKDLERRVVDSDRARQFWDQLSIPLPLQGTVSWADESGEEFNAPKDSGVMGLDSISGLSPQISTGPFFSSLLPRDRIRLWDGMENEPAMSGSIWSRGNRGLDFSHSPTLANKAREHKKRKDAEKGAGDRKTVVRLGDGAHQTDEVNRRRKLGESGMKHGNSYAQESQHDLGDSRQMYALLQLMFGMNNKNLDDHDLFETLRRLGVQGFLDHLIFEANQGGHGSAITEPALRDEDSPLADLPLHLLTDAAGLTHYVNGQDPFNEDGSVNRLADGVLDRADDIYRTYWELPTGMWDETIGDYVFHGLEPTGEQNGHRVSAFRLIEEMLDEVNNQGGTDKTAEDLIIRPYSPAFQTGYPQGALKDVRDALSDSMEIRGGGADASKIREFLEQHIKRQSDGSLRDDDVKRVLEEIAPEGASPDWEPTGNMVNYDRFPLLDPVAREWAEWASDSLRGMDVGNPESGNTQHSFHDNFRHYVISTPSLLDMMEAFGVLDTPASGEQAMTVDAGDGTVMEMFQEMGDVEMDASGRGGRGSGSPQGIILGRHPVSIARDFIERVKDIQNTQDPTSMGWHILQDVIDLQTKEAMEYAYSEHAGLTNGYDLTQGEYAPLDRGGTSSMMRHLFDSMKHYGVIAQALKKHYIAQDPSLEEYFSDDQQGFDNINSLFPVAERLATSHDQSWREKLSKEMEKLGETRLAHHIANPTTDEHWSTPDYDQSSDEKASERMRAAFKGVGAERATGLDLIEYYLNNHYDDDGITKKYKLGKADLPMAKNALVRLRNAASSKKDFIDNLSEHVGAGSIRRADPEDDTSDITGYRYGGWNKARMEYNALMKVAQLVHDDSADSKIPMSVDKAGRILKVPSSFPKATHAGDTAAKNLTTYHGLSDLFDLYEHNPKPKTGTSSIRDRDKVGSLSIGEDFDPASIYDSAGVRSGLGRTSNPNVHYTMKEGKIPDIRVGEPRESGYLAHPSNVQRYLMSEKAWDPAVNLPSTALQTADTGDVEDAGIPPHYTDFAYSLDVLTNVDLLLKGKEGKPISIKPMHRIFDLDDLSSLRGFSGDWIATAWPKGQRLMVEKKKNTVRAWDSEAQSVTLPNLVKKGLKAAYDKNYLIDCIWDMDVLHIIDILKSGDEDVHDEEAKDRTRLLRAKFDATEEVLIPAPINTKRTDSQGLQQCVKDLLKEKGVQRVLLRDAESTYMKGEARHPRWILLGAKREVDLLVLSSKGDRHLLGAGPLPEAIAKKMGNRKQKYDDEWYMDVGSITEAKVEEGQYITVSFSSVTVQNRDSTPVYKVNAPRYVRLSEASATDSIATLKILAGIKEENIPHNVNVQKGSIYLSFPTGQVIYETQPAGKAYLLKEVDAPDDYTLRLAQSQEEYWGPVATVLLRAEKEAVVPEPPANHSKKPKKVIPEKVRIPKDPDEVSDDLSKSYQIAIEELNKILKEKITWTGPKALGIDYATPVNSPSGPTENTEGYNLQDHDPGHRQEKGGDCWCGAMKGQTCEQGSGQKMEHCPDAKPPKDEEGEPKHLQISHHSQDDSSA